DQIDVKQQILPDLHFDAWPQRGAKPWRGHADLVDSRIERGNNVASHCAGGNAPRNIRVLVDDRNGGVRHDGFVGIVDGANDPAGLNLSPAQTSRCQAAQHCGKRLSNHAVPPYPCIAIMYTARSRASQPMSTSVPTRWDSRQVMRESIWSAN